ncbi:peroxiredoxin [Flavobacterium limnosediminis JC2902]|uniref:thioredoxin-dependent peroxiredoxin n=1 Tax=Flavobacterium limnosediminis JC2902 TaxID=1341181 RepID=V6SNW3_9FLAO|nr:peroxiredoxin [Flavobacterium limnosediminis JC2902]
MIKVGDKLPLFEAKDQKGDVFSIASVLHKKVVVIYFYPKDDTPGCTQQACFFRDQYEEFNEIGAEVIGISADSVKSHEEFVTKYKLPFILLSDEDKSLRKLFGVPTHFFGLLPGRVTYVVDKEGVVRLVFDSRNAESHFPKVLETVKKIV